LDTYQAPLPPDISFDFAMTEQNLWGVWCGRDAVLKLIGKGPDVFFEWYLADSFEQIVERSTLPVVAAISLNDMQKSFDMLNKKSSWFEFFPRTFFVKRQNQTIWTDKLLEGDEKLFSGKKSDLEKLLREGQDILSQKDYKRIFFDIRPVSQGHPLDWMDFMARPEVAFAGRQIRKEYGIKWKSDPD